MSGGPVEAAILAAMTAAPEVAAGTAAATAAAPAALGTAFGSADMIASLAPGAGLLGAGGGAAGTAAAGEALPGLLSTEAPIPYGANMAEMADGSMGMMLEGNGMTANPFTGGYDSMNGLQRFGNELMPGEWDWMKQMNPLKMMGSPQQQQQPQQAMMAPPMQQQALGSNGNPYGQNISGGLSEEQKQELRRRYGIA